MRNRKPDRLLSGLIAFGCAVLMVGCTALATTGRASQDVPMLDKFRVPPEVGRTEGETLVVMYREVQLSGSGAVLFTKVNRNPIAGLLPGRYVSFYLPADTHAIGITCWSSSDKNFRVRELALTTDANIPTVISVRFVGKFGDPNCAELQQRSPDVLDEVYADFERIDVAQKIEMGWF